MASLNSNRTETKTAANLHGDDRKTLHGISTAHEAVQRYVKQDLEDNLYAVVE